MGAKNMQDFNNNLKQLKELMQNSDFKDLRESKSLKDLMENVQQDLEQMNNLTKKIYAGYLDDVRTEVLEKTEEIQEKLQKFHEFVENTAAGQKEEEINEEAAEADPASDETGEAAAAETSEAAAETEKEETA